MFNMNYDDDNNACGYGDMFRTDSLSYNETIRVLDFHGLAPSDFLEFVSDIRREQNRDNSMSGDVWLAKVHNDMKDGLPCINAGILSDWLGY